MVWPARLQGLRACNLVLTQYFCVKSALNIGRLFFETKYGIFKCIMPKEDWAANNIARIFSERNLWPFKDGDIISILDVACGLSLKSKFIPAQIRVGVDIFDTYFDHIEADVPYVVVRHDVRTLDEIFMQKALILF